MKSHLKCKISWFIFCLAAVCNSLYFCQAPIKCEAEANTGEITETDNEQQKVFEKIEQLIKQYYPRAKTSHDKQKLHTEYKVHNYQNLYSGRAELAPDVGGILADLEFKPGAYQGAEKLPKSQNQYSYLVLSMAPYSQKLNEHLKTRLCYAPDAPVDFVTSFTELLDEVGKTPVTAATATPTTIAAAPAPAPPTRTPLPTVVLQPAAISTNSTASVNATQTKISSPGRRLFFWKATRGKEVVYLLGTVHIATANFYPLAPEIDEAFDQSKQLVVEVAIDRHSPDRKMVDELVKNYGTYKSPDRLSKHLSPDTKKVLDDYLKWAGETFELYDPYKPWYVTELISASAPRRGEILKMRSSLGLDRYFLGRAKYLGTKVVELETIDSQLHLHARLSDEVQDKLLQVSLLEYKDSLNEMKGIFEVWQAGDPEKLDAIINRTVRAHHDLAPYNKILLDQRNVGMATKIEQLSKASLEPVFVAVGSAHLLGETGLVTSLRKAGFDVQQVYSVGSVNHAAEPDARVFGDERLKVCLPRDPEKKYNPKSQVTQYEVADGPDQLYALNIVEFGSDQNTWKVPGPQSLDALLAMIVKTMNGNVISHHSSTVQDFACRQIEFISKAMPPPPAGKSLAKQSSPADTFFTVKSPGWFAGKYVIARAYLVETKVYVQLACGSKQFIDSSAVSKFMNSLRFIR